MDSGIDWITCTEKLDHTKGLLYETGEGLLQKEVELGNAVENWKWRDFRGYLCGGVSIGLRQGLSIVQLRSDFAKENWETVAAVAGNVSRLDLQTTWSINPGQPTIFSRGKWRADTANNEAAYHRTVTLITSQQKGDTIYLGQRSSPVFGRFYDKGMESGSNGPGILLRQELELKKDVALGTCQAIAESGDSQPFIESLVYSWFRTQGLELRTLNGSSWPLADVARAAAGAGSNDRLSWITATLGPIVRSFISQGRLQQLLDAVGLSDYVMIVNHDGPPADHLNTER